MLYVEEGGGSGSPRKTLAEAFLKSSYRLKNEIYILYAFVLATEAEKKAVFPDLLDHVVELHEITGRSTLVILPHTGSEVTESTLRSIGEKQAPPDRDKTTR